MNRSLLLGFALLLPVLTSCATITKGTTQTVTITTPRVEQANCTVTDGVGMAYQIVTPATLTVEKSKNPLIITCDKPGYQTETLSVSSHFQEMTAGNVLFGGIVGVGVDAASGAMNKYPQHIQVFMHQAQ